MRKLLKNQGVRSTQIVTDKLKSYGAAFRDLCLSHLHVHGHRRNNRAESSHVPIRRRERKMQRFKSQSSAQRFLSIYGPIYNLFNVQRHLISRRTLQIFRNQAMAEWKSVTSMPRRDRCHRGHPGGLSRDAPGVRFVAGTGPVKLTRR